MATRRRQRLWSKVWRKELGMDESSLNRLADEVRKDLKV